MGRPQLRQPRVQAANSRSRADPLVRTLVRGRPLGRPFRDFPVVGRRAVLVRISKAYRPFCASRRNPAAYALETSQAPRSPRPPQHPSVRFPIRIRVHSCSFVAQVFSRFDPVNSHKNVHPSRLAAEQSQKPEIKFAPFLSSYCRPHARLRSLKIAYPHATV